MHGGQRAELGIRRVFYCCVANCHALSGCMPHPPMSSHCWGWASGLSLDGVGPGLISVLRVLFQVCALLIELGAIIYPEISTSCQWRPRAAARGCPPIPALGPSHTGSCLLQLHRTPDVASPHTHPDGLPFINVKSTYWGPKLHL